MSPKRRTVNQVDDDFDPEFDLAASDGNDGVSPRTARAHRTGATPRSPGADDAGPRARSRRAGSSPPAPGTAAKPAKMQPPEDVLGYGVAAILVIIGTVFATVRGKGVHGQTATIIPLAGVVVAIALVVVIRRFGNRFASAMVAVLAALLVETAKPATGVEPLYYVSLVVPLAWAFWLTRRQSKATRALAATQPRLTPEQRRAQRDARKARKKGKDEPALVRATPAKNRRYTPPQPAKPKRSRKEVAAEAAAAAAPRAKEPQSPGPAEDGKPRFRGRAR